MCCDYFKLQVLTTLNFNSNSPNTFLFNPQVSHSLLRTFFEKTIHDSLRFDPSSSLRLTGETRPGAGAAMPFGAWGDSGGLFGASKGFGGLFSGGGLEAGEAGKAGGGDGGDVFVVFLGRGKIGLNLGPIYNFLNTLICYLSILSIQV